MPHLPALDGLRGLAVLAVVVYHYRPSWLPAGFLGVDLFMVLSGFLITSLLLAEHARAGRVRLGAFWARRLRRLVPALLLLLVALAAYAAWIAGNAQRDELRGDGIAALGYFSNWRFIATGGTYVQAFGDPSPLKHAWSLAIEEQFYALWPLVFVGLVAAFRPAPAVMARVVLGLCVVGATASVIAMVVMYDPLRDPSRVYYGTDTRAHALLVGAALAALLRARPLMEPGALRTATKVAATIAVVPVALAARQLDFYESGLYRGGFLVFAVAVAVVVLGAPQGGRNPLRSLLEWRPLRALGAVSYGVYLWHWPVLVILDEGRTGLDGVPLLSLQLAVTAAATALSWFLVEVPVRSGRLRHRRGAGFFAGAVASVLVLVLAATVTTAPSSADSTGTRDTPPVAPPSDRPAPRVDLDPAAIDLAPEPAPMRVLLVGDSAAWSLGGGAISFPQPETYTSSFPPHVVLWNRAIFACELQPGNSRFEGRERAPSGTCTDWEEQWRSATESFDPDFVVLPPTLWDTYDHRVDDRWVEFGTAEHERHWFGTLERARAATTGQGARLVLLSSPLLDADGEPNTRREEGWRMNHLSALAAEFAAARRDDVAFVDLAAFVCPNPECPDLHDLRPDGVHYDPEGAIEVAAWLTGELEALPRAGTDPIPG
jgi:peptidoglycan/LPS O-acetylase OafA/YrhL